MSERRYDKEFKLNAVKLYLANKGTKSIKDIAEDLGISRASLGHWITSYKTEGDKGFVGSGYVINQEVKDLRRELQFVRQERDILKKAVVSSTGQSNNVF